MTVAILLSLALMCVGYGRVLWALEGTKVYLVALTVAVSLLVIVLLSVFAGCVVPFALAAVRCSHVSASTSAVCRAECCCRALSLPRSLAGSLSWVTQCGQDPGHAGPMCQVMMDVGGVLCICVVTEMMLAPSTLT